MSISTETIDAMTDLLELRYLQRTVQNRIDYLERTDELERALNKNLPMMVERLLTTIKDERAKKKGEQKSLLDVELSTGNFYTRKQVEAFPAYQTALDAIAAETGALIEIYEGYTDHEDMGGSSSKRDTRIRIWLAPTEEQLKARAILAA